jgi:hypothetical protein
MATAGEKLTVKGEIGGSPTLCNFAGSSGKKR